jgi:hypothetical protein
VATVIFRSRLPGSNVTVTPPVTCTGLLCRCYIHAAHLVFSSTALTFLTNWSEKRKSAPPSAIQVSNRQKTIGIDDKLHVLMRREKGERIVDIRCNVSVAHGIVHTIH